MRYDIVDVGHHGNAFTTIQIQWTGHSSNRNRKPGSKLQSSMFCCGVVGWFAPCTSAGRTMSAEIVTRLSPSITIGSHIIFWLWAAANHLLFSSGQLGVQPCFCRKTVLSGPPLKELLLRSVEPESRSTVRGRSCMEALQFSFQRA